MKVFMHVCMYVCITYVCMYYTYCVCIYIIRIYACNIRMYVLTIYIYIYIYIYHTARREGDDEVEGGAAHLLVQILKSQCPSKLLSKKVTKYFVLLRMLSGRNISPKVLQSSTWLWRSAACSVFIFWTQMSASYDLY